MANTIYSNVVIGQKATDLLTSKINARSLMTVDTSLTATAGMKKTINTYTYSGTAESLAVGVGSTASSRGSIAYVGKDYDILTIQQAFDYFDEDAMKDENIVGMMTEGATSVMTNKFNSDFFSAIGGATLAVTTTETAFSYDNVVDAIAKLNIEDESALFLLINPDGKADIRKDEDYKSAQMGEVIYNGQIGTIAGIPVVVSKAVPAKTAYIATKEAVTLFLKQDVEVEQDRDADVRKNSVYLRTYYVTALTDATKVCKITHA